MRESTNILAEQAWGRFPICPRHRRRARIAWLGRNILYGWIVLGGAANSFVDRSWLDRSGRAFVEYFVMTTVAGLILCVLAPFQMENRFSNAHRLRGNVHDYYLAGMRGRDILTGIAAPQLAGLKIFAVAFPIVFTLTFALAIYKSNSGPGLDGYIIFISGAAFAELTLVAGSLLNLALWVSTPEKPLRLMKLACFVFFNPILGGICFVVFTQFHATYAIPLVSIALITLVLWPLYARRAWTTAIRRLDAFPG